MFKPPYRELAQFAGNLATCLEAGVGLEQGIESSGRALSSTRLGNAVRDVQDSVHQGNELSAALAAAKAPWPPFLIPFVKAGEQSGRLDYALRYLEQHCRLLDGPARALQRVCLLPLGIVLTGNVLQIFAMFFLASPVRAFWYFAAYFGQNCGMLRPVFFS